MLTSLKHGPKYKCRKINKGCHNLKMRTNGTKHDIPNTDRLREKGGARKGFKRVQNQKGKAKLLNLSNTAAWLTLTCLRPRLFLFGPRRSCPGSISHRSMGVQVKAMTKNQQTNNRRNRCKEHMERHKTDKHDSHGKQRNQKTSKLAKRQTSKKVNKRWCPCGTNVGLDRVSIASLC